MGKFDEYKEKAQEKAQEAATKAKKAMDGDQEKTSGHQDPQHKKQGQWDKDKTARQQHRPDKGQDH